MPLLPIPPSDIPPVPIDIIHRGIGWDDVIFIVILIIWVVVLSLLIFLGLNAHSR